MNLNDLVTALTKDERDFPSQIAKRRIVELRMSNTPEGRVYGAPRIAKVLQEEGHRTKTQGRWHTTSVQRVLAELGLGKYAKTIWVTHPRFEELPAQGARWKGMFRNLEVEGMVIEVGTATDSRRLLLQLD